MLLAAATRPVAASCGVLGSNPSHPPRPGHLGFHQERAVSNKVAAMQKQCAADILNTEMASCVWRNCIYRSEYCPRYLGCS